MPWNNEKPEEQRRKMVRAMLAEESAVAELCRQFGVSRQTAYKYLRRYEEEGRSGLKDRRRGGVSRRRLRKWRQRLLRVRRQCPTWGGRKLKCRLQSKYRWQRLPSERTLDRWLGQYGLARRRTHKRHAQGVAGTWTAAKSCNAVWTADFKGWFRTKLGRRIEPLTVRDLHSRYLLAVEAVKGTGVEEARRLFRKLFYRYGLPKAIRCDLGVPFCSSGPHGLTQLSLWWRRLGIRVEFVRRKQGLNNNAHEQMHRVLQAEVAAHPQRSLRAQIKALRQWQYEYNHHRPHEALGLKTPASRYRPSKRRMPRLLLPRYPKNWMVRSVRTAGDVHIEGRTFGVGRAFQGLPVGFKPVGNGLYEVYFTSLLLGKIDLKAKRTLLQTRGKGGSYAPSL